MANLAPVAAASSLVAASLSATAAVLPGNNNLQYGAPVSPSLVVGTAITPIVHRVTPQPDGTTAESFASFAQRVILTEPSRITHGYFAGAVRAQGVPLNDFDPNTMLSNVVGSSVRFFPATPEGTLTQPSHFARQNIVASAEPTITLVERNFSSIGSSGAPPIPVGAYEFSFGEGILLPAGQFFMVLLPPIDVTAGVTFSRTSAYYPPPSTLDRDLRLNISQINVDVNFASGTVTALSNVGLREVALDLYATPVIPEPSFLGGALFAGAYFASRRRP